jgi:hypothetical protein
VSKQRGLGRSLARPSRLLLGKLDALAVDQHLRLLELAGGGPAGDGVEDGVELVLRALLDPHLPALAAERDEIRPGKGH